MLDTDTKRRIDTCRDILVGKVPDPKSQVEQITIALIYKFMDDMDAEAEELGGKRNFFAGEYGKYGWARVMAPNMGGFDVLALYSEAIQKMNENPGIPALFRDIFKNAYLPYRDPETLRAFLKEIDGFTYDHSERLGDAFEYLLSVLGSQGDAGQFRTPRHIIDFMVEVIDPKKNESMLDPACGTAGFLISAWKHVLKHNTKERSGDQLTPDERANLVANIHGYDISPDMVRLSLVNLYLHGFTDPHIVEYDTLTSEERWNETADVILANPPFMSPKGGIKPHKRFSVQATRSEVLFVDYMAEHLSPQGRAAIVVPEGIIFQSGTAYKALREMLVKNSLVAVVSLPAGVFNPYSGVKTSILILDKRLAKTCDSVLFVKVENDGFNLGAQRRAVTGSDLPDAKRHLLDFFASCGAFENCAMAHKVARARIGETADWNLSGERYSIQEIRDSEYSIVSLGDVCDVIAGQSPEGEYYNESGDGLPFYQGKTEFGERWIGPPKTWTTQVTKIAMPHDVLMSVRAPVGPVSLCVQKSCIGRGLAAIRIKSDATTSHLYIFHLLRSMEEKIKGNSGAVFASISRKEIEAIQIPLPSLAIQEEIVAKIEGYQKVIDGARQVVRSYRPQIVVRPDWPIVLVGDVVEFVSGLTVSIPDVEAEGGTPILAINNVTEDGELTLQGLRWIKPPTKTLNYVQKGDLLFNWRNGSKHLVGKTARFDLDGEYLFASFLLGIRPNADKVDSSFLWHTLNIYRREGRYLQFMRQNVNGLFNREELKMVEIPLPSLETQRTIVAEIEAEQALVNANKQLVERFEAKVKSSINRVWGKDIPVAIKS